MHTWRRGKETEFADADCGQFYLVVDAAIFSNLNSITLFTNCVEAKKDPPLQGSNALGWGILRVLLRFELTVAPGRMSPLNLS